jgi:hypothetical protein
MSVNPEIAGRRQGGQFALGVSGNPASTSHRATRLAEKTDRDACDRLLKAIFDRGLGQRQIARVTCIPLSTVQRALQRVIYPYRQDQPIAPPRTRPPGRSAGSSLKASRSINCSRPEIPQREPSRVRRRRAESRPGSHGSPLSKMKVTRRGGRLPCRVTP